jgi:aminodeoxyfutalosine deaminase
MTVGESIKAALAALPKAELHLHLEGSIAPDTVALLAERHGVQLSTEAVKARYQYTDFLGFIEAFKWVTSYLQTPQDYALITHRLADELLEQRVIYAEVTISVGVMLKRTQDVEANFAAIGEVGERYGAKGLRLGWIFDAARQFGSKAAMEVAHWAAKLQAAGVVAFGMGGDELAFPTADFRAVYDFARNEGLHVVVHAGEVGGPESVREALDSLAPERIGHGIAVMRDPALADRLATARIPLENCLTSNLRTGALAKQTGKPDAGIQNHPLPRFLEKGLEVTLSTDDPAMFETDLLTEYCYAASLGLTPLQLSRLAEASFQRAFLPPEEKRTLLEAFRAGLKASGLV